MLVSSDTLCNTAKDCLRLADVIAKSSEISIQESCQKLDYRCIRYVDVYIL
jgi:hypothetical protein